MNVETWAKALTFWVEYYELGERPAHDIHFFYYDGYLIGAAPGTTARALLDAADDAHPGKYDAFGSPEEAAAAACDALSLPWQRHPVWRMHERAEALQILADGCSKHLWFKATTPPAAKQKWEGDEYDGYTYLTSTVCSTCERMWEARKALDAAKGGG